MVKIIISIILFISISCKKENINNQVPFSINGTWEVKNAYVDSLGDLKIENWRSKISKIEGDSIITSGQGYMIFGNFELSNYDTAVYFYPKPGLKFSIIGRKFNFNYTKLLENQDTIDYKSFGKSILHIASPDSLFCYSTCCDGVYVMIRR